MNTRTSIVALTAFAAMATTALSPTSASAWGAGYGETHNTGPGYGGAPNSAVTHPDPHVPGATVPGPMGRHPPPNPPGNGQAGGVPPSSPPSKSQPGGAPPSNPPGNGPWNQGGQGTQTSGGPGQGGGAPPSNPPGNGPWNQGGPGSQTGGGPWQDGGRPGSECAYGRCWPHSPWHRPWETHGPNGYPVPVPVYNQAPVYTQTPVYTQAPATTYTTAPAPTYSQAPAQPVSQNCNCVSKSYLQDGTVVFTDICTKETAMAAPAGWQQGQTAPQQSSY